MLNQSERECQRYIAHVRFARTLAGVADWLALGALASASAPLGLGRDACSDRCPRAGELSVCYAFFLPFLVHERAGEQVIVQLAGNSGGYQNTDKKQKPPAPVGVFSGILCVQTSNK